MTARIHVMAAAVVDADGRILIAQRSAGAHLGGLWEFPGGKREAGESREQALARELDEELGIQVVDAEPLICVAHDYPDRQVLLDVWRVTRWQGELYPREGQPLVWAQLHEMTNYNFPAADVPVLLALGLPNRYLITPSPGADPEEWLAGLAASLRQGISLIQIRAPDLEGSEFETLAAKAVAVCRQHSEDIQVLVNSDPRVARACGADGVHLNHRRLWAATAESFNNGLLVAASCHNTADLHQARNVGADFAVLGPVKGTLSHPGAEVLGWQQYAQLLDDAAIPVYALGGMSEGDLKHAIQVGSQGVAAIRDFWGGPISPDTGACP